ncbi:MAG TPA: ribonuclease H family protein [Deltaproteobacteria bacterium]|jgi:ribonuclease HI|nr:ribonuclease H family protein [Deltaproteobacteria bacterium]HQI00736.1 ribonuclease H family protein [Deltaproteobacteria bacterium]
MGKTAKKFYAVLRGRRPGIYDAWSGPGGAQEQVEAFPGALYKGFATREDACEYAESSGFRSLPDYTRGERTGGTEPRAGEERSVPAPESGIVIYADGGSINNPGPGGYGVVILENGSRRELSGGYRCTTNNRMELMACIEGLKSLGEGPVRSVTIYTDSRYVAEGINKGWARRWRNNSWMRDAKHRAENIDLWSVLLDLCDRYRPRFVWLKGHSGIRENERCDFLAKQAAKKPDLPPDLAYEKGETALTQPSLF